MQPTEMLIKDLEPVSISSLFQFCSSFVGNILIILKQSIQKLKCEFKVGKYLDFPWASFSTSFEVMERN